VAVFVHAEDESFFATFEQVLDLALHIFHRSHVGDGAVSAIRREDEHSFRLAEDGNVRVVGHEDELPAALSFAQALYDGVVDERVVEIIFRLVDQQWPVRFRAAGSEG
jgi:hypothetical protein